jgi:hypothetical protein
MKWLCTLLVLLLPAVALADENALQGRPTIEISRVSHPPTLDGRLDDAAWKTAAKITKFTQRNPREGAPATEPTEVWLAYDSRNLYVAIYAHYTDVSIMRANRVDRDQTWRDDRVAIYLDTFLDQQRAYRFSVNGYAVQGDAVLNASGHGHGPGGRSEDDSWDALFRTAGGPVADGWIVEMAIPFKSLRYPSRQHGEMHRWGLQIVRTVEAKDEEDDWSPVSRDVNGFLTQEGVLYGMTDLSMSRNLELLPTMTDVRLGSRDSDTGVYSHAGGRPDFGFNLKYGVTSNLTADFTANPDFSQIESDRPQIAVNQRYPLFYPEQRPFFLEGQEIFNTEINLVHTRTIVDPRVGAKITGKVNDTTLGVLVADDDAAGLVDDLPVRAQNQIAHFLIARVRQDLYTESFIGAILTDREFVDSHSRTVGVDGRFRLGRTYRFSFMAAGADYQELDGPRYRAPAFQANFNRSGRGFNYSIRHTNFSPDFYTDTGFIRRNDIQETELNASYTFYPEGTVVNWGPRGQVTRNYDHEGHLQDTQYEAGLNVRFARNIGVRAQASNEMERYDSIDFPKHRYSLNGDASFNSRVSFGGGLRWGDGIRYLEDPEIPFLGRALSGNLSVTARPTARLATNLSLNFSRFRDPLLHRDEFDVRIYRTRTTYQFTDRLQFRNILEYNDYDGTVGVNLLGTYRINAGTAFFLGYDDRRQQAININPDIYDTTRMLQTSRSFFMKIAYLFRY